jgi:hypothetical protein
LLEGDNQALARGKREPGSWSFPECGRRFSKRNQNHVHGRWTVKGDLENKNPEVLELYKRFVELVRECGPFEYAPVRSQIGLRVKRIFARVKLAEKNLEGYLDIDRAIRDPRFHHIAPYQTNLFVHHFRIASET